MELKGKMEPGEAQISRVRRTRQEAQETYDKISRWYDYLEGFWERRLRERGLAMLKVQEGEVVLEIGFGPGHDLFSMAISVGTAGKVHGIDLSPEMAALTHQRVSAAGMADRVSLEQGDALWLPYSDEIFDAIFMSFTLELFDTPEIPKVLAECHRVLRRAGRVAVVSLSKAHGVNFMVKLYEWGHAQFPSLLDCRPIYLRRAMEAAKFEIQEYIQESLFGLPVEITLGIKYNQSNPPADRFEPAGGG